MYSKFEFFLRLVLPLLWLHYIGEAIISVARRCSQKPLAARHSDSEAHQYDFLTQAKIRGERNVPGARGGCGLLDGAAPTQVDISASPQPRTRHPRMEYFHAKGSCGISVGHTKYTNDYLLRVLGVHMLKNEERDNVDTVHTHLFC